MQITSVEIALVGIVVTVALNMIALAFSYGRLTSRVDAIMATLKDMSEALAHYTEIPIRVAHCEECITGLQSTLRNGLTTRVASCEAGLQRLDAICKERHGRQA